MITNLVNHNQKPTLYLIATPIGNLQDMTPRALKTIQEVDILLAEDTRVSMKLLTYYHIERSMMSYHDHNKESQIGKIEQFFKEGKSVGLISDAGVPLVSDPGYELALLAKRLEVNIVAIPGANAALSALVVSTLPTHPYLFYGFLPPKKGKRITELERLLPYPETLIFYEAPHRMQATLRELHQVLGDREAFVGREITKRFEEGLYGTLSELMEKSDWLGELVLVVHGFQAEITASPVSSIKEAIETYRSQGLSKQEAMKRVAKERNVTKSVVYRDYHQEEE